MVVTRLLMPSHCNVCLGLRFHKCCIIMIVSDRTAYIMWGFLTASTYYHNIYIISFNNVLYVVNHELFVFWYIFLYVCIAWDWHCFWLIELVLDTSILGWNTFLSISHNEICLSAVWSLLITVFFLILIVSTQSLSHSLSFWTQRCHNHLLRNSHWFSETCSAPNQP
jgi:hypothetical protein